MSTIVLRSVKNSPLIATEVDANFNNLNTDKAEINSPTFTGIPLAPTAPTGTNTTQLATTAFVKTQNYVTSVSATTPILSSGGATPTLSMDAATTSVSGYLTSADWTTFNNKQNALGFTPYNATNPSNYLVYVNTISTSINSTNTVNLSGGLVNATDIAYSGTLTSGTGVIAIGTNQIYKDASGNVGVGTSSPSSKLTVAGEIAITGGVAAPTFTTRSVGTKVILYSGVDATNVDFALGVDSNTLWNSVPTSANGLFKWYGGVTLAATLSGTGNFTPIKGLRGCYGAGAITSNFAAGDATLIANTTGSSNTAVGVNVLTANTNGYGNTAVGNNALYTNLSGSSNTAVGAFANTTATGSKNTSIGYEAGSAITTGENNIVIGGYTGSTPPISLTGSNNIVISDGAANIRAYYANATSLWTIPNDMAIAGKFYKYQPTPTLTNVDTTLTIAQLLTYIISATPTTDVIYTVPSGTSVDTETSMDINYCFDWNIVNKSAFAITMQEGTTHTIDTFTTGGLIVNANSIATFRTTKTAVNTFISYRTA